MPDTKSKSKRRKFKPRENEVVGGGFMIMRRNPDGVLCKGFGVHPFEHGSLDDAEKERKRLSEKHTDVTFHIFADVKAS